MTDIRVQGYRSVNRARTRFIVKENDISSVPIDDIIVGLKQPLLVEGRG